ncbi:MAG: glycoside hydrolase family 31 protein [Methylobacter sp.]
MAKSFPQDIQWLLTPSGPFISFDAGDLQGRIYQNTGHIEIAGPDLAGNPKANLIHFSPPAVQTGQGSMMIGAVTGSKTLANGLELKQKLGAALITGRLTFLHQGVMRYEVVDWGGVVPIATAIAAPSDSHEHFYGFGEKFNSFDQSGKNVRIMTFDDPGIKNDHSYKVSPWFVSTRGYGLHLDSSAESVFDMRAAAPDRYVITHLFPTLRFNVVYGPKLTDILSRYTGYTGRPPLPPPWTFGPWISSDIWRSGGEVRYAVTQFRKRGLPASAFVFDSPWETAYNDFNFNMTQFGKDATIDGMHFPGFASLAEMMRFLQTNGLKVICWMTPFINTASTNDNVPGQNLGKSVNYDEAASKGLFVRTSAGGPPLLVTWWKGHGSPIDFTNSMARQWLTDQLKKLVEQASVPTFSGAKETTIGGFKTDDGESSNGPNTYIPITAQYSDGRTGVEMRNGYCVEYHKTVASVLGSEGILFARSGFVGSHAFPSSWAGDNEPNFGDNGLPSVIMAGQAAAMSGYAIWGHDTGGYQDTNFSVSPPNLFMRWTQFGCFSPIMQMHRQVAKERQYPWKYGDQALNNFRFFTKLHTRLFPYIYSYAKQASATGLPIIRPLVLMDQSDPNTFNIKHTYLFGNEFLVAPLIKPNAVTRQLYLPPGNWIDFWDHTTHAGGQVITWSNSNQLQFPVFVRAGSIVPMLLTEVETLCDANYVNNAAIKSVDDGLLFQIYRGGSSHFSVYDGTEIKRVVDSGSTVITLLSVERHIQLQVLGNVPVAITRDGLVLTKLATAAELDATETGWRTDDQAQAFFIKFLHRGGTTTIKL